MGYIPMETVRKMDYLDSHGNVGYICTSLDCYDFFVPSWFLDFWLRNLDELLHVVGCYLVVAQTQMVVELLVVLVVAHMPQLEELVVVSAVVAHMPRFEVEVAVEVYLQ
jgi:hypothetical protein